MSQLLELQRQIAAAVMRPLAASDRMRRDTDASLIKPNDRLTAFERLEIYNRQYWFRVLSCFADDFPGLRAIVGARKFERLSRSYLADCPSVSFTLRNLGSRLEEWLRSHPEWIAGSEALALDMVRLEWAHVEAFDGAYLPPLTLADIENADEDFTFRLQPYTRLLKLGHAVDDLLIEVRRYEGDSSTASNNARTGRLRKRVKRYATPSAEPVYLAVHRMDDSVYYKRLDANAFAILWAIAAGEPMEQALLTVFPEPESHLAAVQEWFANWAELGWFCRPGADTSAA